LRKHVIDTFCSRSYIRKGVYEVRVYIGFDDTDTLTAGRGTGKLARWFEQELPEGCCLWGVIRQQLLLDDAIPYTSHNSSACAVIECAQQMSLDLLQARAIAHIERHFIPGSDPGLCVVQEQDPVIPALISFGLLCARKVVTQHEAIAAAEGHLSGLGGTNDGIIGAAAAVGLTAHGWSGRVIEFRGLRDFPGEIAVEALIRAGIRVVSVDRDAHVVAPEDIVETSGWLRPRLWAGQPVLPVTPGESGRWTSLGRKRTSGEK
jgi:hypothetical protein